MKQEEYTAAAAEPKGPPPKCRNVPGRNKGKGRGKPQDGSFVPHDDTFSIKSFSSLVHFSALLGVAKMFVCSL